MIVLHPFVASTFVPGGVLSSLLFQVIFDEAMDSASSSFRSQSSVPVMLGLYFGLFLFGIVVRICARVLSKTARSSRDRDIILQSLDEHGVRLCRRARAVAHCKSFLLCASYFALGASLRGQSQVSSGAVQEQFF